MPFRRRAPRTRPVVQTRVDPRSTAKSAGPAAVTPRDSFADGLIVQLPALRRYATALTGSMNAADDLVQDCIERALRQSHTLQDPQRMGSWLRAILHNLFIDAVRRRRVQGTEVDIADMEQLISTAAPDAVHLDFTRAVNRLSAEHRQVLLMAGLEGLSYREIAAELDMPIGTVMSRLARARERLRIILEPQASPAIAAGSLPGESAE